MLSIIIPCYNEGEKLKGNIEKIKKELSDIDYEIICVNDGSCDETKEIIQHFDSVKTISYDQNKGKGYAVKAGIRASEGDKILFMDADLSTRLDAVKRALNVPGDMVVASRTHKDSVVTGKSFLRELSSYISNLIVRIIIGIPFRDTQCGFKMFTREAGQLFASKQTIDRWAFDVEYFYIAKLNGLSVCEIPVTWKNDRDSRVNIFSDSIKFFIETVKIRKNRKTYYT